MIHPALREKSARKLRDSRMYVVAHEFHALPALDAASARLVDFPHFKLHPVDGVNVRLGTQHDDQSGRTHIVCCELLWGLVANVDAKIEQYPAERELMATPGLVPADVTEILGPASSRMSPAAIWDLPPFLTQTNSTAGFFAVAELEVIASLSG